MTLDTELLESSFRALFFDSRALAKRFYERLFLRHPGFRRLFHGPIEFQERHFAAALERIVKSLRDPEASSDLLRALAAVHVPRGVQPDDYVAFADTLVEAMGEMAGPAWNAELQCVWTCAVRRVLDRILDGLSDVDPREPSLGDSGRPGSYPALPADPLEIAAEYLDLNRRWRDEGHNLSRADLERLRRLRAQLDRLLSSVPPAHGARRSSLRVPVRMEVEFEGAGPSDSGTMMDVAEDGLFVATQRPFETGTRIHLEIVLGVGPEPLAVEGSVAWCRRPGEGSGRPGMGVRFDDLDPKQRATIREMVEEALFLTLARRRISAWIDRSRSGSGSGESR